MLLKIYSLKKVLYEGAAKSLNVQSVDGELTILDNHLPLVAALKNGPIKIRGADDKEEIIPAASGFLEVKPGSEVTILANTE